MKRALVLLGSLVTGGFLSAPASCGEDDEKPPLEGSGDASTARDGTSDGVSGGDARTDGAAPGDSSASDAPNDGAQGVDANDAAPVDAGPCPPQAPTVPGLKIVNVTTSSFSNAYFAKQAPGSDDWYVVQQGGIVKIVRAGAVLATPFLDLTAAMGTGLGERGLLSIAFHPNYAQNGRFFVMGTPGTGANGDFAPINADAVVEFKRTTGNPDIAEPTKVKDIVVLEASDENHNSGTALFGKDGYLYVATGDGGGGCESSKSGQVQDTTKLFGKVLRLNVDANAPYAAAGNPYPNDSRVYHYGLRNPFRFNFDSLTNDLYIGDVGQDSYEEISVVPANAAGKNFGWPAFEGAVQGTCGAKPLGGPAAHTPPIVSIDRRGVSTSPFKDYQSIVGGTVYRGNAIPGLRGIYLFGDVYGNELGAVRYCNGQAHGPTVIDMASITTPNGQFASVSSFVEGHDGELYVTYSYGSRLGKFVLK